MEERLPRSEKFSPARSTALSFFTAIDHQRSVAPWSDRNLASKCEWEMAAAGCFVNRTTGCPTRVSSVPSASPAGTEAPESVASTDKRVTETVKIEHPPRAFVPEVKRINVNDGNFRFRPDWKFRRRFLRGCCSIPAFEIVRPFAAPLALRRSRCVTVSSWKICNHPLRYEADELNLSQISARAGGGEVDGNFTVQPQSGRFSL